MSLDRFDDEPLFLPLPGAENQVEYYQFYATAEIADFELNKASGSDQITFTDAAGTPYAAEHVERNLEIFTQPDTGNAILVFNGHAVVEFGSQMTEAELRADTSWIGNYN